jgi:hypothetical protein
MTERKQSGSPARARSARQEAEALETRRLDMKSAEGHAGSVPRGNPEREEENIGHRQVEYERVLGH